MNKYRVVYETLNGKTEVITVECNNEEDAEAAVYNNCADCLQVLNVN